MFGLGETVMVSPRRKSSIVSLNDVGLRIRVTAAMAVVMAGGEMS
jgi:hypothetical protein